MGGNASLPILLLQLRILCLGLLQDENVGGRYQSLGRFYGNCQSSE